MTDIVEGKPTPEIMEWAGKVHLEEVVKEVEQLQAKLFGMAREIERLKTENDLWVPKATTDSQSVNIK